MVMLGAFHPAIDITAGERERGTLETTLSAPIARSALMAGKVARGGDAGRDLRDAQPRLDVADGAGWRAAGAGRAAAGAALAERRGGAGRRAARRVPVRVGDGRDRRARAQLQGSADAADPRLLPVHGAVAAGGAGRFRPQRRGGPDARRRRDAAGARSHRRAGVAGGDAGGAGQHDGLRHARRWCWRPGSTTRNACWAATRPASPCAPGCAICVFGSRADRAAAGARRRRSPPRRHPRRVTRWRCTRSRG